MENKKAIQQRFKKKSRDSILAAGGVIFILVLWQILYVAGVFDRSLFPSPIKTFGAIFNTIYTGDIFPDIAATLIRAMIGLLLATIMGVIAGLLLGVWKSAYTAFSFVLDFFRSTPVTTLYPVFVLIFGIKHLSKVAMVTWGCFFVIALNSAYGAMQAGQIRTQMAKLYGASRFQVFRWIVFYGALPQTMIGLRVSLSYALIIEVLCEMFMGSQYGLGQLVTEAYTTYAIERLYGIILIVGLLGYLLNQAFVVAEERLGRWMRI